jgi:acetylornithine deacetylase/succinyl-diaminopimelate desuccinylase-like protein
VIPAQASAEIDARLLPSEDPKAFIEEIRKVIADDTIRIETILSFAAATSPSHPEAMRVINEFAKTHDGGVPVLAPMGRGFTDCHFFREKGIPCLGFMPRRTTPGSEGLVHGIDERVSIESLKFSLRALYEIVSKLTVE